MNERTPAPRPDDDADRTVARTRIPNPAGRLPPDPPPARPRDRADRSATVRPRAPLPADAPEGTGDPTATAGLDPLIAAAASLLTLLAAVRNTREADPMALRERVEKQLRDFRGSAPDAHSSPKMLEDASYCLCTAIDEAVLLTPWGRKSEWPKLSLLRALHHDAWGGEKFFWILKERMQDPAPNRALLELLYLCLALGFEGQYAMFEDGRAQLDQLRTSLYDLIRRQRGPVEAELSPHWRNADATRMVLKHPVPVWVAGAVAAALLLATYGFFSYFLSASAGPAIRELNAFVQQPAPILPAPPPTPATPATKPTLISPPPPSPGPAALTRHLQDFLAPEIAAGRVGVDETDTQVRVSIKGAGLFAVGSDTPKPEYRPVIAHIREALLGHQDALRGTILVLGHTDNQPIKRSLRFQDNYDLSLARARSVAALLRDPGITNPIEVDGKGELEPLGGGKPETANATPEQRAANRRVEILIGK